MARIHRLQRVIINTWRRVLAHGVALLPQKNNGAAIAVASCALLCFAWWLPQYLSIPYPTVFGDEYGFYAITRSAADPSYDLSSYKWLYEMRGAFATYGWIYQAAQLREGSPLPLVQFINTLCLALSLPAFWIVARRMVSPNASKVALVLYTLSSFHVLGAFFIIEPLFLLFFWLTLATTIESAGRRSWAAAPPGLLSAVLVSVKPHGLITAVWSLIFLTAIAFSYGPKERWARAVRSSLCFLATFLLVTAGLRYVSGGSSGDTLFGKGYYGAVLTKFTNPTTAFHVLGKALENAGFHLTYYGLIYGVFLAVLVGVSASLLIQKPRWRELRTEDWFGLSMLPLSLGLFLMALLFSAHINETHRIHGRYWAYTLIPLCMAAWRFIQTQQATKGIRLRFITGLTPIFAVFAFYFLSREKLQLTPNDCPEIAWLYLGQWRPSSAIVTIYSVAIATLLCGVLIWIKPKAGYPTAVAILLFNQIAGGINAMSYIRKQAAKQAPAAHLSTIIKSYHDEARSLIITPRSLFARGVQFGLPKMTPILQKPSRTSIDARSIPPNTRFLATITSYEIPTGWSEIWNEGDYFLYQRTSEIFPAQRGDQ